MSLQDVRSVSQQKCAAVLRPEYLAICGNDACLAMVYDQCVRWWRYARKQGLSAWWRSIRQLADDLGGAWSYRTIARKLNELVRRQLLVVVEESTRTKARRFRTVVSDGVSQASDGVSQKQNEGTKTKNTQRPLGRESKPQSTGQKMEQQEQSERHFLGRRYHAVCERTLSVCEGAGLPADLCQKLSQTFSVHEVAGALSLAETSNFGTTQAVIWNLKNRPDVCLQRGRHKASLETGQNLRDAREYATEKIVESVGELAVPQEVLSPEGPPAWQMRLKQSCPAHVWQNGLRLVRVTSYSDELVRLYVKTDDAFVRALVQNDYQHYLSRVFGDRKIMFDAA